MLLRSLPIAVLLTLLSPFFATAEDDQPKFKILFNGIDLSGWSGEEGLWTVSQGAIVGQTTDANPIGGNTFLVWQGGPVSDFEFRCKVRFEGNNSGVQYRSETFQGNEHVLQGYQADLHPSPDYFGMMYGEKYGKRGIIATRGQKIEIRPDGSKHELAKLAKTETLTGTDWNDLRIIAVGNRLIHQVNGTTTIDVTDNDPSAYASGLLGLQLHRGPAMKVEFRSLLLRDLSGDDGQELLSSIQNETTSETDLSATTKPNDDVEKSDWIAAKPEATWIWSTNTSNGQKLHFRKSFALKSKVKSATLYATCDNHLNLFINGNSVGTAPDWMKPIDKKSVKKFLTTGQNSIAAECSNEGGVAAFVFKMVVKLEDGSSVTIVSDDSWKIADTATGDWKATHFDDSAWVTKDIKTLGKLGVDPWSIPNYSNKTAGSGDPLNPKNVLAKPGFIVERLHSVDPNSEGSWVCMTNDADGGFFVSDQGGKGLFHVTFPDGQVNVEPIDVKDSETGQSLSGAQGLLWAFDSLWVHRNGGHLYRVTDSDDDGKLDHAEQYPSQTGGGEHGNHALITTEDGKGIYMVGGNHAPMATMDVQRVQSWNEDLLLTRMWDPRGHARGLMAPGGWVTRLNPQTKEQELYCVGFRNEYDVALNRFGDMFTFDADMEWDLGSPWYRPTRICHVVSGGDYGWRSGSGKWPRYYEDSLPPVVDIGPGSPTGVVVGTGTKFPTKYQDALFALDWTFGTIYAVHMTPDGAGYVGQHEPFVYGSPLPVTDTAVGADGHLYFTVGGRGTGSALFRVSYVGDESTTPPTGDPSAAARAQRRELESFHGRQDAAAISTAWPLLRSEDRFIRHAARVAIESQPVADWASRVFTETDPQAQVTSAVALARLGNADHLQPLLDRLLALDASSLTEGQLVGLLRAYQLAFIRLNKPNDDQRKQVTAALDAIYPNESAAANRELAQLLVYLRSPSVAAKTMQLINEGTEPAMPDWSELASRNAGYGGTVQQMQQNPPPGRGIDLAFSLSNLNVGWNTDLRREFFQFLNAAAKASGGMSYPGYLERIRSESLATATDEERIAVQDITGEDFNPVPDFEITPPEGPGQKWTLDEVLASTNGKPDFERGRNLFFSAECGKCHRMSGLGGGVGPDLTSIPSKFDQRYVAEAIVHPSKDISDQYGSTNVLVDDGTIVTGIVVEKGDVIEVYPIKATDKPVILSRDEIEFMEPSKVSQMPEGLLDRLNQQEVRDLMAYLMSAGNKGDRRYGK